MDSSATSPVLLPAHRSRNLSLRDDAEPTLRMENLKAPQVIAHMALRRRSIGFKPSVITYVIFVARDEQ